MNTVNSIPTLSFTEAPSRILIDNELELLRATEADTVEISKLMKQNLGHLLPYLNWQFVEDDSVSDAPPEFKIADDDAVDYRIMHLGRFVGITTLHSPSQDVAKMGYWLSEEAQGQGIATRATKGLRNTAFNDIGLNTIVLDIKAGNKRSLEVAKRLGAYPIPLATPGYEKWVINREMLDAQIA